MSDDVCVRVAVRIRPLIPKEVLHNHRVCVRVKPPGPGTAAQVVMLGTDRTFDFDHVFGPTSTQDELYESCVQPLVSSLMAGHNVTVLAYGQTGSGKTYTIGGAPVAPLTEEEYGGGGVIERMTHAVFQALQGSKQQAGGVGMEATVSYLELYMEELQDLLALPTAHKDLHIREDCRGNTVVVGAREVPVCSAEELLSVLKTGSALRHTGPTGMNECSSRSHAILTLQLSQHSQHNRPSDSSSPSTRYSKLHLVDLAGSERAKKTGNTGMRFQESVHINTGLLALGNVIRALSDPGRHRRGNNNNQHNHVPYRDAKITRLLRDSLGGSAHTLMVVCMSPSDCHMAETLGALQFASRARRVRNRPRAPCAHGEAALCPAWDPREARLGELEYEVQILREALMEREREKGRGGGGNVMDSSTRANQTDVTRDPDGLLHRLLAQEAALLLEDIGSAALSPSLKQRFEDWQEKLRAINDSDHHTDILQLRRQLNTCQEALAIGEQREEQLRREVQKLLHDNKSHLQSLDEAREHTHAQCDQLEEQQMLIDRLRGELLTFKVATSGVSVEAKDSGNSAGRPHSVPLISHSCGDGPVRKNDMVTVQTQEGEKETQELQNDMVTVQTQGGGREGEKETQELQIHTSPHAFSLERVMAAFKMRGHLLSAEIEAKEEVYCPFINQLEEEREEEQEDEEEENEDTTGFRRTMNRTWTRPVQSQDSTGPLQILQSGILSPQRTELTTGDESSAKLYVEQTGPHGSIAQRRSQVLQELAIKEILINELDNTGEKAQEADKRGRRHGDDSGAAGPPTGGVLGRQARAELQQSSKHMRRQREQLQTILRQELRLEDLTVGDDEGSKEKTLHSMWLKAEEEGVLQKRAELQELEEELRRREEVLQRREACLKKPCTIQVIKLQLEEAIEALDTTLDLKSRSIRDRPKQLSVTASASQQSHSTDSALHCDVIRKLKELSPPEASELLVKCFNKVVGLQEEKRRLRLRCEELRLQSGEQEGLAREQEAALQRLALDTDRRLTQQHRDYQHCVQLLRQQLGDGGAGGAGEAERALKTRVQQLEKDLYFYKSSSRILKKQLKEMLDAKQKQHAHQNPCCTPSPSDLQTHKRTLAHTQTQPDSHHPDSINPMFESRLSLFLEGGFSLVNSNQT